VAVRVSKHGAVRQFSAQEIAAANATLKQDQTPQPSIERVKRNRTKDRIGELYALFKADPALHENKFWNAVTEFARSKMRNPEFQFGNSEGSAEDRAQEIVIEVMRGLTPGETNEFRGDANNFYSWLNRICFTRGADFFNEAKDRKYEEVPLLEFDDTLDNPELYSEEEGSGFSMPTDDYRWLALKNTEWVKPADRSIIEQLILTKSYESAAHISGLSVKAVQERMRRLTTKLGRPVSEWHSQDEDAA
jgi:DNA-directed RNA polymerase specialized sigma24 family protein